MRRLARTILAAPVPVSVSVALAVALALASTVAATSCATYRQDLDRARAHYDKNEFEAALALFRVLEPDMDSFSAAEKAQYAYARGMTDYRLASLATQGSGVADPKKGFRDHSRHWLAVASAIEKTTPGGLSAEEQQRVTDAMTDLNHDVYGAGDPSAVAATSDAGVAAPDASSAPASK